MAIAKPSKVCVRAKIVKKVIKSQEKGGRK